MSHKKPFDELYVKAANGCWLWIGVRGKRPHPLNEYGRVMTDGVRVKAHRFSYERHIGPVPEGLNVLHKCDTPACINPDHLFLGTQQDNIHDCQQKGRWVTPKGERNFNAKLTDELAMQIYQSPGLNTRLAERFGISSVMVGLIKRKKSWRHIHA